MKLTKRLIAVITVAIVLTFTLGACNNGIKNTVYNEYYYSANQGFVSSGRTITINKDNTMIVEIGGSKATASFTNYTNEKYLKVGYKGNFDQTTLENYKTYLETLSGGTFTYEEIVELLNNATKYENMYYYKNYVFMPSSITAYRYVNEFEGYDQNYNTIEGAYIVDGLTEKMLLQNGIIYVQDTSLKEGKYPIQRGTYSIENDFLVMNVTATSGTVEVQQSIKYLIAEITLPSTEALEEAINGEQNEGEDSEVEDTEIDSLYKETLEKMKELNGGKVKVLVSSFFSHKSM